MTRINAGIPVKDLSDQHLMAEHREIKRIPNTKFTSRPTSKFTLGRGHVLFFINKGMYTYSRYVQLHEECLKRGFDVTDFSGNWDVLKDSCSVPYEPTQEDINIVVDRIVERVAASSQIPRFNGVKVTKESYIERLLSLKK